MFNFGENWKNYSLHALDGRAVQDAENSLRGLLKIDTLAGRSVLDLGCGSGLFSIAAVRLGASVTAADINPLCVEVTEQNAARFLTDRSSLKICQLSALDSPGMAACGSYDIVYCWGVLHATGAMWRAIENTLSTVKPGGKLVLGIYNKHVTSPLWRLIKRTYVHLPGFLQRVMALIFAMVIYVAKLLITRRNPLQKGRGMSFWYDVIDWIGGYPYEYAAVDEVVGFVSARGFTAEQIIPAGVPTGVNEFIFMRPNLESSDR